MKNLENCRIKIKAIKIKMLKRT